VRSSITIAWTATSNYWLSFSSMAIHSTIAARWPERSARSARRSATAPSSNRRSQIARSGDGLVVPADLVEDQHAPEMRPPRLGVDGDGLGQRGQGAFGVARHPPGEARPLMRLAPRRVERPRPLECGQL
jgi:hypothetical protein